MIGLEKSRVKRARSNKDGGRLEEASLFELSDKDS